MEKVFTGTAMALGPAVASPAFAAARLVEGGSCHERITPSLALSLFARQVGPERG